jgi:hypothetical protein
MVFLHSLYKEVSSKKSIMRMFSILLFIFISSSVCAQSPDDSISAKPFEQKEIKAADHLRKELEQKQLTALPERIADTTTLLQSRHKRNNKKCKPTTLE